MILKTQINLRIRSDLNISQSYEHIVETDTEAEEAGYEDASKFAAYVEGFARGNGSGE